jgi:glycine cleavage system aminomethyltransferase T
MGTEILDSQGNTIGTVTSGTYCPIRDIPLAMAYVSNQCGQAEQVEVVMQDKRRKGRVEPLPR